MLQLDCTIFTISLHPKRLTIKGSGYIYWFYAENSWKIHTLGEVIWVNILEKGTSFLLDDSLNKVYCSVGSEIEPTILIACIGSEWLT